MSARLRVMQWRDRLTGKPSRAGGQTQPGWQGNPVRMSGKLRGRETSIHALQRDRTARHPSSVLPRFRKAPAEPDTPPRGFGIPSRPSPFPPAGASPATASNRDSCPGGHRPLSAESRDKSAPSHWPFARRLPGFPGLPPEAAPGTSMRARTDLPSFDAARAPSPQACGSRSGQRLSGPRSPGGYLGARLRACGNPGRGLRPRFPRKTPGFPKAGSTARDAGATGIGNPHMPPAYIPPLP
jgi:hypothetical protein